MARADQQEFQTLITEGDFEGAADNFDQTSATIDEALTQVSPDG
jgi:hypothetical protein